MLICEQRVYARTFIVQEPRVLGCSARSSISNDPVWMQVEFEWCRKSKGLGRKMLEGDDEILGSSPQPGTPCQRRNIVALGLVSSPRRLAGSAWRGSTSLVLFKNIAQSCWMVMPNLRPFVAVSRAAVVRSVRRGITLLVARPGTRGGRCVVAYCLWSSAITLEMLQLPATIILNIVLI